MENFSVQDPAIVLHIADENFHTALVVDIKQWQKNEEGPEGFQPFEQILEIKTQSPQTTGYLRPKKHDFL